MALERGCGLGLGTMRLSSRDVTPEVARRIIDEAIERGVRLFDTADVYAPSAVEIGHNESLVAAALAESASRADITLATKGGLRRKGNTWTPDGRAKHLKAACAQSLERLGVEQIDLYQLHAPDPKVNFATSVRALRALQKDGLVRDVGFCNLRLEELEIASDLVPIAAVQVEIHPLEQRFLKNGVARFCAQRGIPLVVHSPLGGHRRVKRLAKDLLLRSIGERHKVSGLEVALAWLRRVDPIVIPLVGATRLASLLSSLHALEVELTEAELHELDEAFPGGKVLRSPTRVPRGNGGGEVVLFVGFPGAGKTTAAESWVAKGYRRVNRDVAGGSLKSLLPTLEAYIEAGEQKLVLDNTYPRRDARFDVIELAAKHGLRTTCAWLDTTLEQSQLNAVRRMVSRFGRLLDAAQIKEEGDANTFTPEAQYRYRRELEPPRMDEGFARIDRIEFTHDAASTGSHRAVFLNDVIVTDERREVLERYRESGFRLLRLLYAPGRTAPQGSPDGDALGIEIYYCSHEPGPSMCWCRLPLPGLGVWLIDKFALDPGRSLAVADTSAENGFAERLGMRPMTSSEFFASRPIE